MKKLNQIIASFLVAWLAFPIHAADWYIDPSATGTNTGTSWENAWNSVAAFEADWANVDPGDTIFLSGGAAGGTKYYTDWRDFDLTGAKSTSSTNRITLTPSDDALHSGTLVWNQTTGTNGGGSGIIDITTSWLVLNGKGRWWLTDYFDPYVQTDGIGIRGLSDVEGTEIHGMIFSNLNNGIRLSSTSGDFAAMARSNKLYQIRGDGGITMFGGGTTSKYVLDNWIEVSKNSEEPPGLGPEEAYGGPDLLQISGGSIVSNNVFWPRPSDVYGDTNVWTSDQHQDVIQGTGSNHIWVNNYVRNNGGAGFQVSTSLSGQTTIENVLIANNVFAIDDPTLTSNPEHFRMFNPTLTTNIHRFRLINNTWVDGTGGANNIRFNSSNQGGDPISATECEISNNIFVNCGGPTFGGNSGIIFMSSLQRSGFTIANNTYYHDDPSVAYITIGGVKTLIADWISTEEPTGEWGLPNFVTPYTTNAANVNFRLTGNNPLVINNGADFSSIINYDKDENPRPYGAAFDRGAYEYSVAGTPTKRRAGGRRTRPILF